MGHAPRTINAMQDSNKHGGFQQACGASTNVCVCVRVCARVHPYREGVPAKGRQRELWGKQDAQLLQ